MFRGTWFCTLAGSLRSSMGLGEKELKLDDDAEIEENDEDESDDEEGEDT